MTEERAQLEENLATLNDEIGWVKKQIVQTMWEEDEIGMRDRALQSRLDVLEVELDDITHSLAEIIHEEELKRAN